MLKRKNGSNVSPCIISQVKYELGLKKVKPLNNKKCSNEYWNEIAKILTKHYSVNKDKYKSILR